MEEVLFQSDIPILNSNIYTNTLLVSFRLVLG